MKTRKMITIPEDDYNDLLESQAFLDCLEACGVDNWDGYEYAVEMLNSESDDD